MNKKPWIIGFLITIAVIIILCIIGLSINDAKLQYETVLKNILACSVILMIGIILNVALRFIIKKLSKMHVEIPTQRGYSNFVKNPVRKKVYIGLTIYTLISLIFMVVVIVISIKNNNEGIFKYTFLPFFMAAILLLPFALSFVKKKEIAFFIEYLNFKYEYNFVPKEDIFGECVFTKDAVISKIYEFNRHADDEEIPESDLIFKDIEIPYNDIKFSAEPVYGTMGDMMTIYICAEIAEHARTKDMLKRIYPNEKIDDFDLEMLIEENMFVFSIFALSQNFYNYFKYYNLQVKDLENIIFNRAELMNRNCRSPLYFYYNAIFRNKNK